MDDRRRGVVEQVEARVHGDAVAADRHARAVDVGVRLRVARLDHCRHVDADRVCEAGELVGKPDVDIAVGRLRELGQLGSLRGPEVPDAIGLRELRAIVELKRGLVELHRAPGRLVVEPTDELGIGPKVGEDPAAEHSLGTVADEEVLATGEPGGLSQRRSEPLTCGVDGDRRLVRNQGSGLKPARHISSRSIHGPVVRLRIGIDDKRHHQHDHRRLGDRCCCVGGRPERTIGDHLLEILVEVSLAGERRDAGVDRVDCSGVDIGTDDLMTSACELHGEWQPDLPQRNHTNDHCYLRGPSNEHYPIPHMRVVSVVGARPQFVKLAPVSRAFGEAGITHETIHTGQHYDHGMSEVFFEELQIEAPRWNLGVGSGSHGAQTGAMLTSLDELLAAERPDWVLTYGDTNSTVAAALAAVKLHLPVAHLEAGLRSFNRLMPEEHNRVLTDHACDILLAPTQVAADHLANEGLADRTVVVGDVMVDVLLRTAEQIDAGSASGLGDRRPTGEYVVATIHRAENTEDLARLRAVVDALSAIPVPVLLPVHPRLRDRASSYGIGLNTGSLHPVDPLSYSELVDAVRGSVAVATDSGGLQKEAYVLGRPTTTIRTETEWIETLDDGWNVLAPDLADLADTVLRPPPVTPVTSPYGTGQAAKAVAAALADR